MHSFIQSVHFISIHSMSFPFRSSYLIHSFHASHSFISLYFFSFQFNSLLFISLTLLFIHAAFESALVSITRSITSFHFLPLQFLSFQCNSDNSISNQLNSSQPLTHSFVHPLLPSFHVIPFHCWCPLLVVEGAVGITALAKISKE